ncbi:hypothetical protein FIV00_10890 [Labrenzia sp. THAF82]|uniref:hypothetical protein n=1 Tax=Labrenzia sp. THAF82 TaxID=2587861 RepID=UPI001268E673|nr:hypothetical protein [Labrenzia sp. THAF82]QFT30984.1 hypothetical protein FIV00_10890 [Labrenzia sp. THAF82]
MARLQRFSGTQSLPGVGSPQVVADTAVGVATQGFGRQIRSSAQDFASLAGTAVQTAQVAQDAKKRQHQIDEAEERNRQKKIRSRVTERSIAERARNRPGGAGYTEDMVAFLEKEHAESLRGLSEEGKTRAEQNFKTDRDRYVSGFAAIEAAENEKYFQHGLAEDEELLIEEVSRDPAQAAGALKRAETLLRSVPLPARVKDTAFQRIKERVAETWIGARPLDERLGVLEAELGVRGNETADVLSVNGARKDASDNKREDLDPEWSEQLQGLSDATLQRIYMGTLAEKSGASAAEAERIERRIEETHGLFDPREIDANTALTPHQKVQLNDLKTFAREEQSINISALKWLNSDGSAEIEALDRQTLSDRAFAFLDDGKADKGAVVRLIAREKGVLPRPYAASLKKDLESDADDKVKTAYESLGSLADLGISSIAEEPYQQSFRASRVKWHLLRDRFGLSPEEAASRLARANGGKREREIRTRFDLDYPQRGSSIALTSRDLLGRVSPPGYLGVDASPSELLNGVDLIGQSSHYKYTGAQYAQRVSPRPGISLLPRLGPLERDEPTGFYFGATPDEAASGFEGVIKRLMFPGLRQGRSPGTETHEDPSLLENRRPDEGNGAETKRRRKNGNGGKKATDSSKNGPHGDRGRAINKAEKQTKDLEAALKQSTSRREKKKLYNKIDRIRDAARRAKSGETHSRRGKGSR